MPFKDFVASQVLTSAEVDDYLMKQAVIVCTSGTRPGSPVEGMTIFETDTDKHLFYNGASWQGIKPGLDSTTIATSETTASTSYVDLATVGPAVSIVTGASALVVLTAHISASVADSGYMSFAVSGASTIAAADTKALKITSASAGNPDQASALFVVTGLTAGSNTFTAKYRQNGASTGTYINRTLMVVPL